MKARFSILLFLSSLLSLHGCGRIGFDPLPDEHPDATDADDSSHADSSSNRLNDTDTPIDTPIDTTDSASSDSEALNFSDTATHSDSHSESAPTDADSQSDVASDTHEDSGWQTDTASDTQANADTHTDITADTDTDSVPDSAPEPDTGIDSATDSDAVTDSDTRADCPPLPAETVLMGETDAAGYGSFGTASVTWQSVGASEFDSSWRCVMPVWSGDTVESQLLSAVNTSISQGDHLVSEFWTRCVASAAGNCQVGMLVEGTAAPWTNAVQYTVSAGSGWKFHQVPFVSPVDFDAGSVQVSFRLGYSDQTVDIYPKRLIRFDGYDDVSCLPNTTNLYDDIRIVSTPGLTVPVGDAYIYRVDINASPTATLTADNLPSWLTLDSGRKLIYGMPGSQNVGMSAPITITATSTNPDRITTQSWQLEVTDNPELVGYWPLDETSGNIAADESGNGFDGSVFGNPAWTANDVDNGALHCNGYDGQIDYVEMPDAEALHNVQDSSYTLSAWVNPIDVPSGTGVSDNSYGYGIIIKSGRHTGLWYSHNQQFHATHHFDTTNIEAKSGIHAPGAYYHVASVFDVDARTFILYVNGVYAAQQNMTGSETFYDFSDTKWRIGVANPSGSSYAMISNIIVDDVRIYRRALSPAEIELLARR